MTSKKFQKNLAIQNTTSTSMVGMFSFLVTLILFVTISGVDIVFAQQRQNPAPAPANTSAGAKKKGKEHTLSFEDELVEGANAKPELFYLFQKKKFHYKRLIKVRENFLPEMKKTSEDLQRSRSQN